MNIRKIQIRNFKCFEEETFELNPQFNVFIGDNGKGKTAVLDAVALVLGDFISFLDYETIPQAFIQEKNTRIKTIDGQPRPQYPVEIKSFTKLWERELDVRKIEHSGSPSSYIGTDYGEIFYEKVKESRIKSGIIFPLLAYYGTGRLWGKEEDEIKYQKQEEGIMMAYPDCLEPNATSKAFFSWYKTLVYEVKAAERERDKIALKVVNDAICSMIPDWAGMYFSFKEDDIIGFLDGEERQFSQLSDGYRNTIGMVADMIYRCIQLNPHLGENTLKETPGVVLIDELDLHLHPNWQRHIVSDLKRIFPKVQFIATTHSPFIVQSLTDKELINLDEKFGKDGELGLDDDPSKYSLEDVSEYEMGVKNPQRSERFMEMMETAAAYYQLIAEGKNSKNNEETARLKEKLDELESFYSDDAAYVALLQIQRNSNGL